MESDEWQSGEITLLINNIPVKLNLTVPARPVKPQAMLPVFQKMANAFADLGVRAVESVNRSVSCKKGCGACCRQPVPLTEVEIYYIAQLVDDLPEPRRAEIRTRFEKADAHFNGKGWLPRLEACETEGEVERVVLDYFFEGIPCPFLEEESCSIHADRPITCREYLVTSPSEQCSNPIATMLDRVPLPMTVTGGLSALGRTGRLSKRN